MVGFALLAMLVSTDSTDVVRYGARGMIVYLPDEHKVILVDTAWVQYRDLTVTSDSIEYNTTTKTLEALKKAALASLTQNITGDRLCYDIDSKRGMMTNGTTAIEKGTFWGREIWLVRENTLNVNDGYYTTCDTAPYHYWFYAPRMKVFLNDMVITQPVLLYIHDLPVLAAPFWFFPISKNRKSGLMPFKIGQSNSEGRYAKSLSYYWVVNDYADMTFSLDIMEKKGFMPKLEGVYSVKPFVQGIFVGTYIQETDTRLRRWSFTMNHKSMMPWGALLDARADFQSDRSYDPDYAENTIVWLKKESRSYASLSRSFSFMAANLIFQQYTNYDIDSTQVQIPSLSFTFFGRPIFPARVDPRWFNKIYWSGNLSAANVRTSWRDSTVLPAHDTADLRRSAGLTTGLSATQKIFGAVNLSEGISYTHTIVPYAVTTPVAQVTYGLNASANLSFYRVYGINLLGARGMLHQFTPSVTYRYTPRVRLAGFFGLPVIPGAGTTNQLSFDVPNLFQAKVGEKKEKRDILVVTVGSGYDFLKPEAPLSPIGVGVDFPSLTKIKTRAGLSYDIYNHTFSYSITSSADLSTFIGLALGDSGTTPPKGLILRVNHYYSKEADNLTYQIGMNVTRNWNVNVTGGYDIKNRTMVDYKLSITRDLHCWQGIFSASGLGSKWVYDFKIQIKDLPDIQIGKTLWGFLPS